MALYQLTERAYRDHRIMEGGEIVEIPDDEIPGRTWQPHGDGPHREYERRPPREPTIKDLDWK